MEKKAGRNKGKKYEKPLSLHPLKFEDALKSMFRDPSMKFSVRPKRKRDKEK